MGVKRHGMTFEPISTEIYGVSLDSAAEYDGSNWIIDATFAIGLGPATQRLFVIPVFVIHGEVNDLMIGLVVWFGFLLNLSVVEWILLRERRGRPGLVNASLQGAL